MGASQTKGDQQGSDQCGLDVPEHRRAILKHIVSLVLPTAGGESRFNLDALERPRQSKMEITKDPVDTSRPLKNVGTDIVVNDFFRTDDTLFRFMNMVVTTFEEALALYRSARHLNERQLFFVYKGGNILRIVSKEFLLELPASATREIAEFYAPFFKRSDADFSIYLDPRIDNYDRIYYEITLLAYLVQYRLRYYFTEHAERYFNFARYKSSYQSEVLRPWLAKFNEAMPPPPEPQSPFVNFRIGDAIAIPFDQSPAPPFEYAPNADVTLRFVSPEEDWNLPVRQAVLGEIGMPPEGTTMTITHNSSLDFGSEGDRRRFNLTRTKFIFTLQRADNSLTNVGGELIDVSIPHRADDSQLHFFETMDKNVVDYDLHFDDCDLRFKSYSLDYLTADLERILFVQNYVPWEDAKYAKRLNRLFYMYFINLFIALENATQKLQVMRDLREMVLRPVAETGDARTVAKGLRAFDKRHGQLGLNLNQLLKGLVQTAQRSADGPDQFREMGKVLLQNADFIIGAVENVREYCSRGSGGRASEADLYQGIDTRRLV